MVGLHEDIASVAAEARQAFESRTIARPLLRQLYAACNPSALDIDNYVSFTADKFPNGNCDITSIYLQHVLGKGEVIAGEYCLKRSIEAHYFLKVGELIVDITADQFGGPPVYVGPLDFPWLQAA